MEHGIAIRSWENFIRVSRDHPAPERLRAEIDATSERVADALAEGFDVGSVSRNPDAVILVRTLVLECDFDARADRSQAARALARRCAAALVNAVASGSGEVLQFDSRGEFVARFVEDLAEGHAWGQWYYHAFEGVRALPRGAAIRTVLLENPTVGRQALAAIRTDAWAAVAVALEHNEAARVLEELFAEDIAEIPRTHHDAWLATLAAPFVATLSAPAPAIALALLGATLRGGRGATRLDISSARLLSALVVLIRLGAESAAQALARGDVRDLASFEPELAAELAREFVGSNAPALRSLALGAHRALRQDAAVPASADAPMSLPAPFAGLALLLEEIDRLLDEDVAAALPTLEGEPTRELAAQLILALGAGERARLVWHDPLWHRFLGLSVGLRWDSYREAVCVSGADSAMRARRALARAAEHHRRGEAIETAFALSGERLRLSVDSSNGLWLSAPACDSGGVPAGSARFVTRLSAARRARADWHALGDESLSPSLPFEWRAFFIASAQLAWRRIAQRVPGMTGASIEYLRENLVGLGGTGVQVAPGRWHWTLRRPPLYVLLNITGVARSTQRWRGPPERSIEWEYDW
jgi:hypothetical protein